PAGGDRASLRVLRQRPDLELHHRRDPADPRRPGRRPVGRFDGMACGAYHLTSWSVGGGMGASWKLEDAKARFSEVVRKAQTEGVQRVTVRGREAVAVISVDELDRLMGIQPQ